MLRKYIPEYPKKTTLTVVFFGIIPLPNLLGRFYELFGRLGKR